MQITITAQGIITASADPRFTYTYVISGNYVHVDVT